MKVISNQSGLFENYFENRGRRLHETDPVVIINHFISTREPVKM